MHNRYRALLLFCVLFVQGYTGLLVVAPAAAESEGKPQSEAEVRVADWLELHRHRPPVLRAFMQRMPKGGDIHTHLSGAVYAESYIEWAADWCIEQLHVQ